MCTFSLCMIVKNEEDTLARCLDSTEDLFDEIIIVDTGSTDKTKEIALNYTSRVFDYQWKDDFASARNEAFLKATMEYIMWLDADDIILSEDLSKLKELKSSMDDSIDAIMMKYNVGFNSEGKVMFSFFRERIIKNTHAPVWQDPVHEYMILQGNVVKKDIAVTHKKKHAGTNRNLLIYKKMIESGVILSPRSLYYYAKELFEHEWYLDAIIYFEKFLSNSDGWIEDKISACSYLSKCYISMNRMDDAIKVLFRSFEYDIPRAEICCNIGQYFLNKLNYSTAAYWYKTALVNKEPENYIGFHNDEYETYIPNMQLCFCYDKMKQYKLAKEYNEAASLYHPNDKAVLYNRQYFESMNMVDDSDTKDTYQKNNN